jgi:hypothetical protein
MLDLDELGDNTTREAQLECLLRKAINGAPGWVAIGGNFRRIGQGHPLAKLSEEQLNRVREMRESGHTLEEIAGLMRVGKACVWKVIQGRRRSSTVAFYAPPGGFTAAERQFVLDRLPDSRKRLIQMAAAERKARQAQPSITQLSSVMQSWLGLPASEGR